jgi:4-hydroxy-3-polyprenylbenzoate decarboxylase
LTESQDKRLIVGVTGATGIVYAARALKVLRSIGIETHLIVSRGKVIARLEMGVAPQGARGHI